ncbi:MAG: (2E,6E)-farnesyl diphosphate synthase [Gammaproteobacteria bacterium]|nr:(2E,6E)-farnesyl diphosphate synthase [Gammaproteobacteria bacterium]MCP5135681.1 (2E,6E)-farnesyl diphosphate synthase [Gammaproteobacteria bacterium]
MSDQDQLEALLAALAARSRTAIDASLPGATTLPTRLHEAMRYSALDGGKCIRPMLVYSAGKAVGAPDSRLDAPAVAVELIHAYSLVHDDLPAMDDDELRRGRPTCHKAFDEATAILVGDGLQALAFQQLAQDPNLDIDPAVKLRMVQILAQAAGSRGMVGGQAIDLESEGKQLNIAALEDMHIHKTGALIRASVTLGALCADGVDESRLAGLDHYAKCIGLAFQIHDDVLDVVSDTKTLGKTQGADQARNKSTYPALMGLDNARRRADELRNDALASIADLDERADPLRWLANYIVSRKR